MVLLRTPVRWKSQQFFITKGLDFCVNRQSQAMAVIGFIAKVISSNYGKYGALSRLGFH